jgi:hypothetical protein
MYRRQINGVAVELVFHAAGVDRLGVMFAVARSASPLDEDARAEVQAWAEEECPSCRVELKFW